MNNLEQIMCRNQVHIYKIVSKLVQADTRILILLNFSWEIPIISERNPFRYHIINLLENFSSGVVFGLLLGAALVS